MDKQNVFSASTDGILSKLLQWGPSVTPLPWTMGEKFWLLQMKSEYFAKCLAVKCDCSEEQLTARITEAKEAIVDYYGNQCDQDFWAFILKGISKNSSKFPNQMVK